MNFDCPADKMAFKQALYALKYRGVPNLEREADLFQNAELLAARVDVPQSLLDHLYTNSRRGPVSRTDWEKRVRTAFCIDHMIRDIRSLRRPDYLIDRGKSRDAFGQIDPSKRRRGGFCRL